MPSAIPTSPPTVPIPLKISADDMTIAYDDPTAWNVTAAPAVVSVALSLEIYRIRAYESFLTFQYRSKNKIRSVVAGLDLSHTSSTKPLINLGLGDPTVFGLHNPSEACIGAVQEALLSGSANGYVAGTGDKPACAAVARYHSKWDGVKYEAEDVTLVSTRK